MKFFIQACLIVSLFLFFGIDANAGASICIAQACQQSEEKCLNAEQFRCSVGGMSDQTQCSWCGDFCVDSCPITGPVTIIPTMGQWGMIIATILLGFFAVFAIRRRIKS